LSDGAGGFTAAQTLDLNGYGLSYNLGEDHFEDLDGDGHIDLIAHNNFVDLKIFWGQGNGAFNQQSTLAMLGGGFLNGFKDLNGDGLMDIVSAPDGFSLTVTTPAFALNNGDRTFTGGQLSVDTFGAVLIDDFSGDGIDDYLMSQPSAVYDNLISIYVQNTESTESAVTISMQSQAEAQDLLEVFDRALQKLGERRAQIGATTSRLESALAGTNIAMENLSGAKSQILDVDIASETAELTRLQILQQAQASVLLQANSNLQIALSLLRP